MNTNGIDIEQLKSDTDKKKYVELGYITEYPDVTILYINHIYTKGSNYLMIKHNGMTVSVIKELNNALMKQGIRIYLHEYCPSCPTQLVMAQPEKYKV
ncbi:hypothetical protein UFOVP449_12 [uncultured Caudovirales phage]|uniref:Uncharacterized protein n=1 Tax=uncultured Caudovirales phage TaxID=2100421 RepID=A0A6J5M5I8_9CAUD|nr:hypothetical protein UFOVP449_12 [uncultured Caudovirales phage]